MSIKSENDIHELKQANPEYYVWKRFDELLISWLLASILEEMFSNVANCLSASDVWKTLEHYFVSESKVRIVNLKNALQNCKKGSLSVQEYIRRLKEIYDTLVAYGQQITEEELISYVIDGLGLEYKPIVAIIMTKLCSYDEKLCLVDVKLSLQKYEQRLNKVSTFGFDYGSNTTNLVGRNIVGNHANALYSNVHFGQNNNIERGGQKRFRPVSNESNSYPQGRGRGKFPNKPKVVCQLCGKTGHMALQCYHRFDVTYLGQTQSQEPNSHGSSSATITYITTQTSNPNTYITQIPTDTPNPNTYIT